MATQKEKEVIHELDKSIALLTVEVQNNGKRITSLESKVTNGLSHKTDQMYRWWEEWIKEREEKKAIDLQEDQQKHEFELLGMKMSKELRNHIITGVIASLPTIILLLRSP